MSEHSADKTMNYFNQNLCTLNENVKTLMDAMNIMFDVVNNHEYTLNNVLNNENFKKSFQDKLECISSIGKNSDSCNDIIVTDSQIEVANHVQIVPQCTETDNFDQNSVTTYSNSDIFELSNLDIDDNFAYLNTYYSTWNDMDAKPLVDYSSSGSSCTDNVQEDLLDDVSSIYSELSILQTEYKTLPSISISPIPNSDRTEISEHITMDKLYCILPYNHYVKDVFSQFDCKKLDLSTQYTKTFDNRCVAYYGQNKYSYGNVTHEPQPLSDNQYLTKLISYFEVVYPDLQFNSAMVNCYRDGNQCIPHHSDSEDDICDGSDIVTISLGEKRTLEFTEIKSTHHSSVTLNHGDVLIMSKASQLHYTHGIPTEADKGLRLSVTLRLIRSNAVSESRKDTREQDCFSDSLASDLYNIGDSHTDDSNMDDPYIEDCNILDSCDGYVEEQEQQTMGYQPVTKSKYSGSKNTQCNIDTLYISSSMFRYLDPHRMSSKSQSAKVLFYPGADAAQMLGKLLHDPDFLTLNKMNVKKIFVLSGTNNIDKIFNRSMNTSHTKGQLSNLLYRLWLMFDNAQINVLTILPREHSGKNAIVTELNDHLHHECISHGLNFINTESLDYPMFTLNSGGSRDNRMFMNGFDNVHMSTVGYSKLARYLKYLAHKR